MADDKPQVMEVGIQQSRLEIAQYSNHLVVQLDGEVCYLHFCQIQPPLILEPEEANFAELTLKAQPLASIAVSREKIQSFVNVIQAQLDRFRSPRDPLPDATSSSTKGSA